MISFTGFAGLDLNATRQDHSAYLATFSSTILNFGYSRSFDLFFNGEPVKMSSDGGETCDESHLRSIFNNKTERSLFSLAYDWSYSLRVPRRWCASTFSNTETIEGLTVEGPMIRSYPQNTTSAFNCTVQSLLIRHLTIEVFNRKVLHPQVFAQTETMRIEYSLIGKLELNLFKDLTSLRSFFLKIFNLRGLMQANGFGWARYLNYYRSRPVEWPPGLLANKSLSNESRLELDQNKFFVTIELMTNLDDSDGIFFPMADYAFPGENFCLFVDYPHDKLAFTLILPLEDDSCTCTILWLYRNVAFYVQHGVDRDYFWKGHFTHYSTVNDTVEFQLAYTNCSIPDRIEKCQLESASTNKSIGTWGQFC
jgi:hypothetical protein